MNPTISYFVTILFKHKAFRLWLTPGQQWYDTWGELCALASPDYLGSSKLMEVQDSSLPVHSVTKVDVGLAGQCFSGLCCH